MERWKHTYTVACKPTERKSYLEAFLANINWEVVAERLR